MAVKTGRVKPRRSISSVNQRRARKESSIIQRDVPGVFVDKDMYCEHTGQSGS